MLEEELKDIAFYFFAALSGIFLYISLASLFPVLQDMIDDQVVIGKIPTRDYDVSMILGYFDDGQESHRGQQMRRLFLANLGFLTAMGLVLPLVYFEEDLQKNLSLIHI